MEELAFKIIYYILVIIIAYILKIPTMIINSFYLKKDSKIFDSKIELKEQENIYSTKIALAKSYPSKLGYSRMFARGWGISKIFVKEEGLLIFIKKVKRFERTLGLKYSDIQSLTLERDKRLWGFGYFVTVKVSNGIEAEEIIFATNNDYELFDNIRRCYKGEMIGFY